MTLHHLRGWGFWLAVAALAACRGPAPIEPELMPVHGMSSAQIDADLLRARASRVLFAHHSVGRDLLSGVARLSDVREGAGLRLVPLERAAGEPGPIWIDASGGRNGDPDSKLDFFAAAVRSQASLKPQLAFMKFCFADFNPDSDADRIFDRYRSTLSALEKEHPDVAFAHVTVPLTRRPSDMKARLLRAIGRAVWEDESNAKRHAFNQRLLETFSAHRVFDLAGAESTRPDGSREVFQHQSGVYYALAPMYTEDGEHLNALGQDRMGAEMIRFVARALAAPPAGTKTRTQ